eukprot:TRINITY_DN29731_c0_g2_i1.p1 TRINITY_DN29731_c0_g2~~TRINITY_DN29731_c0_g2_i1.p1  ORF type:complete len:453 (-),score=102.28 TRINITY_DN29731_c0_g2_i1:39-1247(-)
MEDGGAKASGVPGTDNGVGEVRFDHASTTAEALKRMNGTTLGGSVITVAPDPTSKDNTKLLISGLPAGIEWQELKDHFAEVGTVAFVNIKGGNRSGHKLKGEVRFGTADEAQQAMSILQGTEMEDGSKISITLDPLSKDGSKLLVGDLPPGTGWQDLKDHFAQVGLPVLYAGILGGGGGFSSGAGGMGGGAKHGGIESFGMMGGTSVGEVRFESPEVAKQAMMSLNGSELGGSQIFVMAAPGSADGSKLLVQGISPGTQWQDLKDHCSQVGPVAFCQIMPANPMGMGMGMGMPMPMMPMMAGGGGMGGHPVMFMANPAMMSGMMGGGMMGSKMGMPAMMMGCGGGGCGKGGGGRHGQHMKQMVPMMVPMSSFMMGGGGCGGCGRGNGGGGKRGRGAKGMMLY